MEKMKKPTRIPEPPKPTRIPQSSETSTQQRLAFSRKFKTGLRNNEVPNINADFLRFKNTMNVCVIFNQHVLQCLEKKVDVLRLENEVKYSRFWLAVITTFESSGINILHDDKLVQFSTASDCNFIIQKGSTRELGVAHEGKKFVITQCMKSAPFVGEHLRFQICAEGKTISQPILFDTALPWGEEKLFEYIRNTMVNFVAEPDADTDEEAEDDKSRQL